MSPILFLILTGVLALTWGLVAESFIPIGGWFVVLIFVITVADNPGQWRAPANGSTQESSTLAAEAQAQPTPEATPTPETKNENIYSDAVVEEYYNDGTENVEWGIWAKTFVDTNGCQYLVFSSGKGGLTTQERKDTSGKQICSGKVPSKRLDDEKPVPVKKM